MIISLKQTRKIYYDKLECRFENFLESYMKTNHLDFPTDFQKIL